MRPRTRLRVLAVAAVLVLPVVAVSTAVAGSATATLSASSAVVTFGDTVALSGSLSGDPTCSAGRTVGLEWRSAGSATFAPVASGVTGADGSFAFEQAPGSTGRFRATVTASASCVAAASDEVAVRVRALVEASTSSSDAEAGSCLDVFVVVSPPKPGQTVEVQHRSEHRWTTIASSTLNGDGQGRVQTCPGWDDLGVARFRARWASQDQLNETSTSAVLALDVTQAPWMGRIDDLVGRRAVSVSVSEEGSAMYRHADGAARIPASNEKLLLAMTSLDTMGPDLRIRTHAAVRSWANGVVPGDLWLLGRGDPLLGPHPLGVLADELVAAGLVRVEGSVRGSTAYFQRDWDAPGWNDVARDYVNRPTALAYRGNRDRDPEREAARNLTKQLEKRGVRVVGEAGAGAPPTGLTDLATIESRPLRVLLAKTLRPSWNFGAEMLGKGLGAEVRGAPGTIAKGAATIQAWVRSHGAEFTLFDNSGLSYANRVTAAGIVELLTQAEEQDWGDDLRRALPTGGQGTLEHRLHGVEVRAKTGTLTDVSALSGWVFAEHRGAWIEFSILSSGMSKSAAVDVEDRIVRILQDDAG